MMAAIISSAVLVPIALPLVNLTTSRQSPVRQGAVPHPCQSTSGSIVFDAKRDD